MTTEGIADRSFRATATGEVFDGSGYLTGVAIAGTGNAGRLTLTDGSGGDVILDLDTPGNNEYEQFKSMDLPFTSGVWISTFNSLKGVTVFIRRW